jgi:hypothetical protein
LKDDRDVALEMVRMDGNILQYLSANKWGDEEVVLSAVDENVHALK